MVFLFQKDFLYCFFQKIKLGRVEPIKREGLICKVLMVVLVKYVSIGFA